MRKHFLLLFLMSLLPFYGWAADGDITTEPAGFTGVSALTYDGTEQELLDNLGAVSGTNFKIYFKAVKAGEAVPTWNATEWTKTSPKATNAGTYYVYFVAYDEVAQLTPTVGAFVSSVINKAALVEGAAKDYTKPAGATGLEYNGNAQTLIATAGAIVTTGGTGSAEKCGSFSYALGVKVNNEWTDEGCTYGASLPKGTNAGTYRVYWKLSGSDNSAEVKSYIDVTITALALDAYDAAKYTYTTKTLTYNGAAQTDLPTIAVKKGAKTLAAGTDYDVVWYKKVGAGAPTYSDENKQVPTYAKYQGSDITYYARVEGKGNYSGNVSHDADADETKIWKVTVAQKSMMTYVQPLSKTYNGEKVAVTVTSGNTNITNAQVVTTGLLSADEDLKAQLWTMFSRGSESETAIPDATLAEWNATATAPVNYRKNGYPMVAHVVHPAAPGADDFFVDDNYAITFMQVGVLSINQRELKVTAKKQQKQYTGEQVDIDHTIDIAGDDATVQIADADATTGIVGTEDVTALMQINLKDFATAEYIEKDIYSGAILVTATADQLTSNYFITGTAGDFEITGKALKLIAATSEKPYGYKLGADVLNWLTDVPSVTTLNGTPEYEVRDADDNLKNIGDLLERGIYTITITNGTELAPENYSIAAADVFSGTLTITKKALKATVVSQSVSKDAVVASGAGNTLLQGTDYVEFDGLVGDEVVKYEIYSGQSTATPGTTYNGVITVKLVAPLATETTFSNDNYTLADADITKGNLTVNEANTVVLKRDEADLVEFIKNNKWTAGDAQTIMFADDRKIDAETWNSFVLPFDIKVKDLSKAAGVDYCVVNVLNPTATKVVDGKAQVRFNLTMGEIKANTPFLMKTVTSKAKGTAITVTGKIVEAVETSVKNSDEDITFNALYAKKVMKANNEFPANTADNGAWKKGNDSEDPDEQVRLSALASYIAVPAGTLARIFVEDFENGTTVIKELGVDGTNKAYALDGWYTLNGVKLQGAPTEKGIYINNGKKVVIK